HPVAQPAERVAADLGEPDGSVRRYRETRKPRARRRNRELREASARVTADLVSAKLEEPDGARRVDRDVARRAAARGDVELAEPAIARDAHETVHILERRPHRALPAHGDAVGCRADGVRREARERAPF